MKAIFRWELPLLAAALIALVLLALAPNGSRTAYADACAADATVSEGNLQFRFEDTDGNLVSLEGFSVNIDPDPRDETDAAVDVDDNDSEGDNDVPDSSGIEGRIDVNAACFTDHTVPDYSYDFVGSILAGSEAEEAGCLITSIPDNDFSDDVEPDTYNNETLTGGDPNPSVYQFEVTCANVIIVKQATGANGTATFEYSIDGGNTSPDESPIDCNSDSFDLVPDPNEDQVGVICGTGVTVAVIETGLEAGWTFDSVSCVATGDAGATWQGPGDPNGPDNDPNTFDVEIDLGDAEAMDTVTCTFVNTEDEPGGGTIDITKDVIGTDASFDFDFTMEAGGDCDDNSADFDLMDTDVESRDCDTGFTYSFEENVLAGYTITDIDCTGSTADIAITGATVGATDGFEDGDDTVEVTLTDPADFADCTFENTEDVVAEDGEIVIRKDVIGTNDDFGFSVGGDVAAECSPTAVSPDLGDGDFETFMCTTTGGPFTYTFTEDSLPAGYTLTDITCTGDAEIVISGSGVGDTDAFEEGDDTVEVTFDASGDDADCTFENTEDAAEEGNLRITVEKEDEDSDFDDEEFDFDINDGTAECDDTSLDNVNPGDSAFTDCDVQDDDEIEIEEDLPVDWEINDITCDEENIGSGGVTIDIDEDNARVTITVDDETELDEGAEVICTFDNDPTGDTTGDIVVRKDANGADSNDDFDFDVTSDDGIDCTNDDFTLTGDGDSNGIDCDFDDVDANDEIVIEEHNLPAGWELVEINCDADDSGVDFDYDINGEDGGSVTISLPSDFETADQNIDCEFVNEQTVVTPEVGPPARTQTVATLATLGCAASELINITVTDADGDPVANGTPVTVTASIGTVTPAATSTSNGGAVVLYTAPASTGGIALITAVAGGIVGQTQVVINCAPTPTPTTPPPPPPPPPPPAVDTGAGVIRPPSTGDAGLVDSKSSGWQLPALALLAVSLTVAGMTLVARRAA